MPQAKSATRNWPMEAGSAQSTPSSLATASRARSAAEGRQGVEGGEVLAVGNEALEDAAGQVVGLVYAGGADRLGGLAQAAQDGGCVTGRQLRQQVLGNGENGPIVDVQDVVPGGQQRAFRVGGRVTAHQVQRLDLGVHAGDALVEDQRVGDDGAGHAAGLGHVRHAEQLRHLPRDGRPAGVYGVEELGRGVNAGLEGGGGLVHGALGDGDQAHEVGQVGDAACEPAGGREPLHAGGRGGEDAVGEAGVGEGGAEVGGIADCGGIAQGNGRLDGAGVDGHGQAEARAGLRFDVGGGQVFGFDDDGRAAGVGDEQIGLQGGAVRDDAGMLGEHLAAGQHGL